MHSGQHKLAVAYLEFIKHSNICSLFVSPDAGFAGTTCVSEPQKKAKLELQNQKKT